MRTQRLGTVLTVINFVLFLLLLTQARPLVAQNVAPVLRGRALEIVDNQGRVRASITVEPAVTMNSRTYPETVLLRLTDPKRGPVVKLTASEEGSALGLSDDAEGGVQIFARNMGSFVKVVSKEGRTRLIKP
ncbi:MAG: hypothetical protein DCC55_30490 [Chloroflexi bacterium]|nr:MAG: hypothetical protein DCC55_30490 [Chloroflexota bacterium]